MLSNQVRFNNSFDCCRFVVDGGRSFYEEPHEAHMTVLPRRGWEAEHCDTELFIVDTGLWNLSVSHPPPHPLQMSISGDGVSFDPSVVQISTKTPRAVIAVTGDVAGEIPIKFNITGTDWQSLCVLAVVAP